MKKRFLSRVKERLFLIVVIFVYSVLAFINLGDFVSPQTFETLLPDEIITISLPEEKEVSKVIFYTWTTDNDFDIKYQVDNLMEKPFKVNGPFQWVSININKKATNIYIRPQVQREISYGEFGVLDKDSNLIEDISIQRSTFKSTAKFTDEQELVPSERTSMNSIIFDEVYFAQTAYQYATGTRGYETVHPPLGKILQSIPIALTGKMTPFTWRFMGTLTGIIIIIAVYYLALLLFKEKYFANIAAILISLSCMHFTQTRVGTVDSYLCLFTILSYFFMFKFVDKPEKFRNFVLSGIFFGCACSVKWSGAFGGAGLAIILFNYLIKSGLFKKGNAKKILAWFFKGLSCFILIPLIIYSASYLLFPNTTEAHSLADVYDQGVNLFTYHANESSPHNASSPWYSWPISFRGFTFFVSEDGSKTSGLIGNYILCYVSVVALLITLYFAVKKHDKLSLRILIPYLSLWIPYAFITRPMFLYHYLSASIFAILAIVNLIQKFPESRKFLVRVIVGSALILFILLYPQMTGVI